MPVLSAFSPGLELSPAMAQAGSSELRLARVLARRGPR